MYNYKACINLLSVLSNRRGQDAHGGVGGIYIKTCQVIIILDILIGLVRVHIPVTILLVTTCQVSRAT